MGSGTRTIYASELPTFWAKGRGDVAGSWAFTRDNLTETWDRIFTKEPK
jgi:hypothetical protein